MDEVHRLIDEELKARHPLGGGWAWLARELRLGPNGDQIVNNWKRRGVPTARYGDIADVLGWSSDVLNLKIPPPKWGGKKPPVTGDTDLSYAGRPKTPLKVPVVGTAKLGADGFYVELESPTGFGDGFIEHYSSDANAYGVRVKGDSMYPAIRHGQVVVVEPNGQLVPTEYVLVALRDGRKMVKELVTGREDSITLVSVNGGDRLTIQREEVEFIHAVAAVVPASKWRPE